MSKLIKNSKKKTGKSPGSLIYMGDKQPDGIAISIVNYNKDSFRERITQDFSTIVKLAEPNELTWLNIDGIHHVETIQKIGKLFNIHPLTLEDILNTSHRPKSEFNKDYIYIVLKMIKPDETGNNLVQEQVSIIINRDFLLSFQEDKIDEFESIRERIKQENSNIREWGTDYLGYRLLDLIVDNYFLVLEHIGDKMEIIEKELLERPDQSITKLIYKVKEDLILLRRAAWPLRDAINTLEKTDSPLINKEMMPYLRDVYDHIVQIIDTTENYREMISSMLDIYLTSTSNKMNEIMKVLTIISTLFIPLNFIAGLYGMNFNTQVSKFNMPELNWVFGYPAVLSVMLLVIIGLLLFFKRKKWL